MIQQTKSFPAYIKEIRKQLELSQEDLAHALGVPETRDTH
jgi:DNA-binding transcriptional regulator YiaG